MAKVKAPLLSHSATGALANAIQYQRPHGKQIARRLTADTISRASRAASPAQVGQRQWYRAALDAWNALTPEQQAAYQPGANRLNMTALNYFLHVWEQPMQRTESDNFNRANGPLGSNWTTGQGDQTIASSVCRVVDGEDALAYWSAGAAFSANQFAQAKVVSDRFRPEYIGVAVRASGSGASLNAYSYYATNTSTESRDYLNAWINGEWQDLGEPGLYLDDGDVIRMEVTGTNPVQIKLYKNGTLFHTHNDSTFLIAAGRPGIALYWEGALDDWTGGNL